ncbi:MerR family transcriptional regulator [Paenibacillus sp. PvP052]|uniref:MerR family transcriptional regulator n=1 Tax=Paenibacillus sp. PvP052 TaxID=2817853 RepID=UPI001AE4B9DF|nr:MerR family transcriptional regulator [Paenibacillus sp. PvP052]MBP2442560.1 DNA-binding transcriptional MerR regulator [Paenibacillus sp. PvP052]
MGDAKSIDPRDFLYTSKQVCQELGIASSTLRTWCLRIEDAGHSFYREKRGNNADDSGVRMFYERDILALRKMKKMLDDGHSLDKATEQTILEYSKIYKVMTVPVIQDDAYKEMAVSSTLMASEDRYLMIPEEMSNQLKLLENVPELIRMVQEQKRENEYLRDMVIHLDEQQKQVLHNQYEQKKQDEEERTRVEERDRLLMETLRELRKPWWKNFFG